MNKNLLRSFAPFFALLTFTTLFYACNQNENDSFTSEAVETFVDNAVFNLEESGNVGRFGCYELVFPITIVFADETTTEIEDYDGLVDAITNWKEANPDSTGRPSFVFPIEVLDEDGELVSVASQEELRELKRACSKNSFGKRGKIGHRNKCGQCFDLVYPLAIAFPDGSTLEVADRMELKEAIRSWKTENPDATERPELAYPITVELEDGTTMEITTAEDLTALKESCDDTAG